MNQNNQSLKNLHTIFNTAKILQFKRVLKHIRSNSDLKQIEHSLQNFFRELIETKEQDKRDAVKKNFQGLMKIYFANVLKKYKVSLKGDKIKLEIRGDKYDNQKL